MNSVVITGRLAADIEIKTTSNGKTVATYDIAVKRDRQKDVADFITCVSWEGQAKFLAQYAHKGDVIGVIGCLQKRSYDKDGKKVWISEVWSDKVDIISHKPQSTQTEQMTDAVLPPERTEPTFTELSDDSELPF